MKNRGNNPGFLCINAWQKINMSKMYKTLFLTDWKCCGIVFKDGKGIEGVFREFFSIRERKSPAASFLKFRKFLSFPPEPHF